LPPIIPNDVKPSYSGELLLSSASGFLIYKTGRLNAFFDYVEKDWGTGANIGVWAPTKKDDPAFQEWLAKRERVSASRAAVTTLMRMNSMIEKWHKQPLKGPRS
jgi:hypothetical protein